MGGEYPRSAQSVDDWVPPKPIYEVLTQAKYDRRDPKPNCYVIANKRGIVEDVDKAWCLVQSEKTGSWTARLPNEILLIIFQQLLLVENRDEARRNHLQIRLVCRRWHEVAVDPLCTLAIDYPISWYPGADPHRFKGLMNQSIEWLDAGKARRMLDCSVEGLTNSAIQVVDGHLLIAAAGQKGVCVWNEDGELVSNITSETAQSVTFVEYAGRDHLLIRKPNSLEIWPIKGAAYARKSWHAVSGNQLHIVEHFGQKALIFLRANAGLGHQTLHVKRDGEVHPENTAVVFSTILPVEFGGQGYVIGLDHEHHAHYLSLAETEYVRKAIPNLSPLALHTLLPPIAVDEEVWCPIWVGRAGDNVPCIQFFRLSQADGGEIQLSTSDGYRCTSDHMVVDVCVEDGVVYASDQGGTTHCWELDKHDSPTIGKVIPPSFNAAKGTELNNYGSYSCSVYHKGRLVTGWNRLAGDLDQIKTHHMPNVLYLDAGRKGCRAVFMQNGELHCVNPDDSIPGRINMQELQRSSQEILWDGRRLLLLVGQDGRISLYCCNSSEEEERTRAALMGSISRLPKVVLTGLGVLNALLIARMIYNSVVRVGQGLQTVWRSVE